MPRMTTRRWMIAVAALALLIAPPAWLIRQVNRRMAELYGPDGPIRRGRDFADGAAGALALVRAGRFADAEEAAVEARAAALQPVAAGAAPVTSP